MKKIKKIGILGGAFNPPHQGHLILAKTALKKLKLQKIIFIPCGVPALKKSSLAPKEDRLEMTKILIERNPKFEVSDYEIKKRKKSYTIDTILYLKKKYKNSKIFWLIGEDSLREIIEGKWKGGMKILNLAQFVVFTRPSHKFNLKRLPKKFKKRAKEVLKKITKINFKVPISATKIRMRIKNGQKITSLVPKKVLNYIKEKKLYS